MEKVEKAVLEIYKPPIGGQKPPGTLEKEVPFQFNPAQLSLVKETSWARHTTRLAPYAAVPEFVGSQPTTLTMTIVLDAAKPSDPSVDNRVRTLLDCCRPEDKSVTNNQASPPWVMLRWGHCKAANFHAVVRRLSVQYTRFSSNGYPLRAVCELALEEVGT
ncbi:hypothetical protein ABT071_22100 [Streptomyces sp. NPDC002506]|uniref:CIS tube protein n=1 Tax=Streptomyces sp. NPDC002506 TaxID=3154536 RepID=UPI003331D94E